MSITAGFKAKLSVVGATTAVTGEACSHVTGQVYQVTSAAKHVLNPKATIKVYDNGVDKTSEIVAIDAMFAKFVFADAYSVTGPVTADLSYYPRLVVANASKASAKCKLNTKDTTPINSSGDVQVTPTTRSATFAASLFDDLRTDLDSSTDGEQSFYAALASGDPSVLELDLAGDGSRVIRAWVVSTEADVDAAAADVVNGSMSWDLADQSSGIISAGIAFGAA